MRSNLRVVFSAYVREAFFSNAKKKNLGGKTRRCGALRRPRRHRVPAPALRRYPRAEPRQRPLAGACVPSLVERFDTEFNPDFSAKSPNFRGLVLFCIEADFCTQIRIFQHFSRTTRFAILCTAPISKKWAKFRETFSDFFPKFRKNRYFSTFFIEFCTDFDQNFTDFRRIF